MPKAIPGSLLRLLHKYCGLEQGSASDSLLLDRFVRLRDETAFEVLLWRHGSLVLKVCQDVLQDAFEAEDAFQASFLVLARKAGSIGKRASVASWLYKVALRIALKARTQRARRNAHERSGLVQLPDRPVNNDADAADVCELRPVLYEEIARLPRKYQAPLVLCSLEGKTLLEAALQLGWAKGTVAGRLARARHMLQRRLQRRGLILSGGLLLNLVGNAAAAVSPPLAQTTMKAALLFAAGKTAGVSAKALALANGGIHAMLFTQVKIVAGIVVLVAALATGVGTLTQGGPAREAFEGEQQVQPGGDKPAPPTLGAAKVRNEPRVIRLVSAREGVILVVGTEVKDPDKSTAGQKIAIRYGGPKRIFRKLKVGDRVEEGQDLLRLDDRLALNELQIAKAKLNAAQADLAVTVETYRESVERHEAAKSLYTRKLLGAEEYREKLLAMNKYKEDIEAKKAAVDVARFGIDKAEIILDMHIVNSPVRGVIRAIHKYPGEGVKALDPVIEIAPD